MAKAREKPESKASKIGPEKSAGKVPLKRRIPKPKEDEQQPVEDRKCSFCGRSPTSTNLMIAGPPPNNSFICETCVEVCITVLLDEANSDWTRRLLRLMSATKKSKIIPLENKKKGEGK